MPGETAHQLKYLDNVRVLNANNGLDQTSEHWAAVVAFYSALHLVERLASVENLHHVRHAGPGSRRQYLANHRQHRAILSDYMSLQSASEIARYHSLDEFRHIYPVGAVRSNLISGSLQRIEDYAASFFRQIDPPPIPPAAGS